MTGKRYTEGWFYCKNCTRYTTDFIQEYYGKLCTICGYRLRVKRRSRGGKEHHVEVLVKRY